MGLAAPLLASKPKATASSTSRLSKSNVEESKLVPRSTIDDSNVTTKTWTKTPELPLSSLCYFEVSVLATGQNGIVGIGLAPFDAAAPTGGFIPEDQLHTMPGWKWGSYGFHR